MTEGATTEVSGKADEPEIQRLPLDAWHRNHGGRMVPFAGYEMPIQYEGIVAEHNWTRSSAGLFDVSHMGQLVFRGADAATALEAVLPGDIVNLGEGRMRYSLLLKKDGGILDDLMVTKRNGSDGEEVYVVVNGATKYDDIEYILEHLPDDVTMNLLDEQALLALQGPESAHVLARLVPGVEKLVFMTASAFNWRGADVWISRSGYTGEDGFEISLPCQIAATFADVLIEQREVRPIGLGARDSLRLEAGLPLYGHDLDTDTTPVAADLSFALSKRRRDKRDFPGADRIISEREVGSDMKRVGVLIEGRQPVREGAELVNDNGDPIGRVTSGGFSPTLGRSIAMASVPRQHSAPGTVVRLKQRDRFHTGIVTPMPFVPHRYVRQGGN